MRTKYFAIIAVFALAVCLLFVMADTDTEAAGDEFTLEELRTNPENYYWISCEEEDSTLILSNSDNPEHPELKKLTINWETQGIDTILFKNGFTIPSDCEVYGGINDENWLFEENLRIEGTLDTWIDLTSTASDATLTIEGGQIKGSGAFVMDGDVILIGCRSPSLSFTFTDISIKADSSCEVGGFNLTMVDDSGKYLMRGAIWGLKFEDEGFTFYTETYVTNGNKRAVFSGDVSSVPEQSPMIQIGRTEQVDVVFDNLSLKGPIDLFFNPFSNNLFLNDDSGRVCYDEDVKFIFSNEFVERGYIKSLSERPMEVKLYYSYDATDYQLYEHTVNDEGKTGVALTLVPCTGIADLSKRYFFVEGEGGGSVDLTESNPTCEEGYELDGYYLDGESMVKIDDPEHFLLVHNMEVYVQAKAVEPGPTPPGPTPGPTPEPEPTPVPTPSEDAGAENIIFVAGVAMAVLALFAVAFMIARVRR